jgi:hypothetical protein
MRVWLTVASLAMAFIACSYAQGQSTGAPKLGGSEEYLGVWEAFEEGTTPKTADGEQPSALVVLLDSANRIVVFFAQRTPDRQIKFHYGYATFEGGSLRFVDQTRVRYQLSFGSSLDHGRFLSVKWDYRGVDGGLGSYQRAVVK